MVMIEGGKEGKLQISPEVSLLMPTRPSN